MSDGGVVFAIVLLILVLAILLLVCRDKVKKHLRHLAGMETPTAGEAETVPIAQVYVPARYSSDLLSSHISRHRLFPGGRQM